MDVFQNDLQIMFLVEWLLYMTDGRLAAEYDYQFASYRYWRFSYKPTSSHPGEVTSHRTSFK